MQRETQFRRLKARTMAVSMPRDFVRVSGNVGIIADDAYGIQVENIKDEYGEVSVRLIRAVRHSYEPTQDFILLENNTTSSYQSSGEQEEHSTIEITDALQEAIKNHLDTELDDPEEHLAYIREKLAFSYS